jgi:hypothetical protein
MQVLGVGGPWSEDRTRQKVKNARVVDGPHSATIKQWWTTRVDQQPVGRWCTSWCTSLLSRSL